MEKEKGLPLNEMLKKLNIVPRIDIDKYPDTLNDYYLSVKDFKSNSRQGINTTRKIIKLIDDGTLIIDLISFFNEFLCKYLISEINSNDNYLNVSNVQKEKIIEQFNKAIERYNEIRRIISKSLTGI